MFGSIIYLLFPKTEKRTEVSQDVNHTRSEQVLPVLGAGAVPSMLFMAWVWTGCTGRAVEVRDGCLLPVREGAPHVFCSGN